ncbi:MAG: ABC transporter substrate-binding protein, partial [Acetobacteraceae bacterium]
LLGTAALAAGSALSAPAVHAQGAGRTLILAAPGAPEGFDGDALRPGTQEVVVQCYEGLTRYGRVIRDGRPYLNPDVIEGHLAESWTTSPDGKTWVFRLRQGVRSPFGNELTAEDVEWSWAKSFAQRRTGAFIANVSNVTAVKALNRYDVEFTLSAPSMILLAALTLYVPGIYDSTEAKRHATADDPWALRWMETNTAGYGAYHVESVRAGEQAVIIANRNYFREQPHFQRVIYRAVPSAASRITLLRSGQVQWIHRPLLQQVAELRSAPRVKTEDSFGRTIASIRMNMSIAPFTDRRVRQAFNFAVDKQALIQGVFFGLAEPARSIVPPIVAGYDPSFFNYDYNPQRARQLLQEANFDFNQQIEVLYSQIFNWEEPMSIQVASQLQQIGVRARAPRITDSDMRARGAPARQDMPMFSFEDGPIVLDPVYSNFLLAHSQGVSNRARFANPQVDAAIDEARQSLDPARRIELMRTVQRIWMEEAPWIVTAYPTVWEAMAPNIVGWCPHPDDHERWYDLRVG